jgi:phosphotransferase system  glucose/maltose/N-acetylglucosamine-specific IIC component
VAFILSVICFSFCAFFLCVFCFSFFGLATERKTNDRNIIATERQTNNRQHKSHRQKNK